VGLSGSLEGSPPLSTANIPRRQTKEFMTKSVGTKQRLDALAKASSKERPVYFECTKCAYRTTRRKTLNEHRRLKHGPSRVVKIHKCPIDGCAYSSQHKYLINRHLSDTHSIGTRWHKCHLCQHRSKQKSQLKQHLADKHNVDVKWYICPHSMCTYKSKQLANLNSHIVYKHLD